MNPDSQIPGPITSGTLIAGRYEVLSFLGKGGFATVYVARQAHLDRLVALKVLEVPSKRDDPTGYEQRFLREAQIAAQIVHPNIVTIYEFGFTEPDRRPFIAMELLDGHDLAEHLSAQGPIDSDRTLRLLTGCLDALGEGHKRGIVHKDLKPANLFLSHPGTAKEALRILDFGIARVNDPDHQRLTATGQFLGTLQYAAPEYLQEQVVTPALDVYQMGIILVEMLTGRFVVDAQTPFLCIMAHTSGNLRVSEDLRRGALGGVLRRALSVDHTQRYADAHALLTALREVDPRAVWAGDEVTGKQHFPAEPRLTGPAWLGRTQTGEHTADDPGAGPRPPAEQPQPASHTQPSDRPAQRRHAVVAAALLVVVCGVLLAVYVAAIGGRGDAEPDAPSAPTTAAPTSGPALTETPATTAGAVPTARAAAKPPAERWHVQPQTVDALVSGALASAAGTDQPPILGTTVSVRVTSKPGGATVLRDADVLGATPVTLSLDASATELVLVLRKAGYADLPVALVPSVDLDVSQRLTKRRSPPAVKNATKEVARPSGARGAGEAPGAKGLIIVR